MGHGYAVNLGHVDRVPGYGVAVIARAKLTSYLLDDENGKGKAAFFKSIGYTKENADQLDRDLKDGLKNNGGEVRLKSANGEIGYNVVMELGVTKKAMVLTAWQVDKEGDPPRFITAYPAKKNRGRTE